MKEAIISVAYYAKNKGVEQAILKSDDVRRKTLSACYAMPGYEALPLSEKNKVYDEMKKQFAN